MRWAEVAIAGSLVVAAGVQLLGAIGFALLLGSLLSLDPSFNLVVALLNAGLTGVVVVAAALLLGLFDLVVAAGLVGRRPWGWFLGVILGVLYVPTYFTFLGILMLLVLFHEDVRAAFRDAAAEGVQNGSGESS